MSIEFHDSSRRSDVRSESFDLLFCALGYETRCTFASSQLADQYEKGVCFRFTDRNTLAFERNLQEFRRLGFEEVPWSGDLDQSKIQEELRLLLINSTKSVTRVGIDVSSMTRQLAALIVRTCCSFFEVQHRPTVVTILYSPALFVDPVRSLVPVSTVGPVTPHYSGWAEYPERPAYAIIGMGYEFGRAIGALDYLDASDTWLFKPEGMDPRFELHVNEVNRDLVALLGPDRLVPYKVYDPYDAFIRLRSLIEGLTRTGRVILVPFGPKLFSTLCLIVAEAIGPSVSVWRVSANTTEEPVDRKPQGSLVSFSFTIQR